MRFWFKLTDSTFIKLADILTNLPEKTRGEGKKAESASVDENHFRAQWGTYSTVALQSLSRAHPWRGKNKSTLYRDTTACWRGSNKGKKKVKKKKKWKKWKKRKQKYIYSLTKYFFCPPKEWPINPSKKNVKTNPKNPKSRASRWKDGRCVGYALQTKISWRPWEWTLTTVGTALVGFKYSWCATSGEGQTKKPWE